MSPQVLATGALWYVAFLLSLTCHEAAHALAAKLGGDLTAFRGGQASLNPLPHIRREPFGTALIPIISYALGGWMIGWGSAPYDPNWQRRYPRRAGGMALAGPAANLALVVLVAGAIHVGIALETFAAPASVRFTEVVASRSAGLAGVATFLSILFSLNLLLAAFNLLPFPPLDGHAALALVLPAGATRRIVSAGRHPVFGSLGILAGWMIFDRLFQPVFLAAINLLYPGALYR